jgi:hypothetical protein
VTELRTIPTQKQQLDADVISLLERTLADAREGKFESVAICLIPADGSACTRFSHGVDVARRIGALELLKWDLMGMHT